MKNIIIGAAVVIGAIGIGVGGAYAVTRSMPEADTTVLFQRGLPSLEDDQTRSLRSDKLRVFQFYGQGMHEGGMQDPRGMEKFGNGMMQPRLPGQPRTESFGPGMMRPDRKGQDTVLQNLERISIDDAAEKAQAYAAAQGDNLRVVEVMEFKQNFYAVVLETDTGKGAFELLINPLSGRVTPEIGPNMMWNDKYGHMRSADEASPTNQVTMDEALTLAQAKLDQRVSGAVVMPDGIDFYGYYSFDYQVDGKVAGMLSVNGADGQVWLHNWHGGFISEKEIE